MGDPAIGIPQVTPNPVLLEIAKTAAYWMATKGTPLHPDWQERVFALGDLEGGPEIIAEALESALSPDWDE